MSIEKVGVAILLVLSTTSAPLQAQSEVAPEASLLRKLSGMGMAAFAVRFSPDGRVLAGAGRDQVVRLWDQTDGRLLRSLRGHTNLVYDLAFSPDGRRIASASGDKSVRIWDVATGALVRTFAGLGAGPTSVAFTPDGTTIAAGLTDGKIRLWNATSGAPLRLLQVTDERISSIAVDPDGRTIAAADAEGVVHLWTPSTGMVRKLSGHDCCLNDVAFSPDGALVASAGGDGAVRLWEVSSGEQVLTISEEGTDEGYTVGFSSVAFSPDGRWLATSILLDGGDEDYASGFDRRHDGDAAHLWVQPRADGAFHSIQVWDAQTGDRVGGFATGAQHWDLDFSPNGQFLASAGNFGDSGGVIHQFLARPFALEILVAYPEIATQLAPRDEFETQPEFVARLAKGQRAYLDTLRSLEKAAALELAKRIRASRETVELPAFSEASGVTLGRYDADRGRYGITVDGRDTSIAMPPAEARELSASRERAVITAVRQLSPDGARYLLYNRELVHPVTQKRYPIGERIRP